MTKADRIAAFLSWWFWRRWRIYCPPMGNIADFDLRYRAELNREGWRCSDASRFFPPMELDNE